MMSLQRSEVGEDTTGRFQAKQGHRVCVRMVKYLHLDEQTKLVVSGESTNLHRTLSD